MRFSTRICLGLAGAVLALASVTHAAAPTELAPNVYLLTGVFTPGQQPDGNTLIFVGPEGLVVFDTGRHPEHTQGILDFAVQKTRKVVAVLNSHWHLDHIGGNVLLRKAFPEVRIYATSALQDALGGFLATYKSQLQAEIANNEGKPEVQKPMQTELALIEAGPVLAPDEVVEAAASRKLGGLELQLGREPYSATAADLWVFDPASGILASGDLLTLPAPFLDTACPRGWREALDRLASVPFRQLVPGHGPPMDRQQFEVYRTAFGRFLDCGAGKSEVKVCIDGWLADAKPLLEGQDPAFTEALLGYYVQTSLRAEPTHTAKLCGD